MSGKISKAWLATAGVVVLAGAIGVGWWMGKERQSATPAPAVVSQPAAAAGGGDAKPALPASAVVGAADPFAALSCQPRQYNDTLALAVTFTQPVDAKADLDSYLQVTDTGSAADKDSESAATNGDQPASVRPGDSAPKGKILKGNWVVGDNPRMVYFPYVQPQRSYAISVRAGLPGSGAGVKLAEASNCEVNTQAMPPSFYFASRGVVLPAGQNGGLPVATVNVPEVDVQFLRVSPERVPELFDSVLGIGRSAGSGEEEDSGDEEDNWRYSDNRSLKGSVSNWDLDRLNSLTTSVYQGRFVTDDKPNRRHVTFLPVEGVKELQEPGIYIAVMSQPGRFRYEYQVTYFYVSDIGLHARRYSDRIEAYSVSLKSGTAISGAVFELVDGAGKSLAKAAADGQGHVRFDGSFANARVIRASRDKEMTVLALGEPALDLSEFDIGGHVSRPNNLFVYAGRNLYRPGETFNVSVLPRDLDGRMLSPSPLTATIKRPDGRTVLSTLWQPKKDLPGYIERSHRSAAGRADRHLAAGVARRPRVARSGCLVEVPGRGIPARTHEDVADLRSRGAVAGRNADRGCAGRLSLRRARRRQPPAVQLPGQARPFCAAPAMARLHLRRRGRRYPPPFRGAARNGPGRQGPRPARGRSAHGRHAFADEGAGVGQPA